MQKNTESEKQREGRIKKELKRGVASTRQLHIVFVAKRQLHQVTSFVFPHAQNNYPVTVQSMRE
jgi:hypothetical protein